MATIRQSTEGRINAGGGYPFMSLGQNIFEGPDIVVGPIAVRDNTISITPTEGTHIVTNPETGAIYVREQHIGLETDYYTITP